MEEDEYKSTYDELASVPCVFEKALTNNQAKCSLSRHFCLADREGYSCESAESSSKCSELLKKLREKSIFVLKLRDAQDPLPHNMEIRVQVGGITGLAKLRNTEVVNQQTLQADDIHKILSESINKFGSIDALPYGEIMQSVVQFQGRRRRQR